MILNKKFQTKKILDKTDLNKEKTMNKKYLIMRKSIE